MKPELTQAGIEAAAEELNHSYDYESLLTGTGVDCTKAVTDGFIKGANHVLSHLPDYSIGFAEWTQHEMWSYSQSSSVWGKQSGFTYKIMTSPELHAEYVKHLEKQKGGKNGK